MVNLNLIVLILFQCSEKIFKKASQRPVEARILYLVICFVLFVASGFYPNMETTIFNYDVKPDFNADLSIWKVGIHQKGLLHSAGYFKIFI